MSGTLILVEALCESEQRLRRIRRVLGGVMQESQRTQWKNCDRPVGRSFREPKIWVSVSQME